MREGKKKRKEEVLPFTGKFNLHAVFKALHDLLTVAYRLPRYHMQAHTPSVAHSCWDLSCLFLFFFYREHSGLSQKFTVSWGHGTLLQNFKHLLVLQRWLLCTRDCGTISPYFFFLWSIEWLNEKTKTNHYLEHKIERNIQCAKLFLGSVITHTSNKGVLYIVMSP